MTATMHPDSMDRERATQAFTEIAFKRIFILEKKRKI